MSKDKKRKFKVYFETNTSAEYSKLNPSQNIIQKDEVFSHRLLKMEMLKVFSLALAIITIFIGLFIYDLKTGQITLFAERLSSSIIK